MLRGPLSSGWCGGASGPLLPEGSGEPRLVLGSPERFLLRAGKQVDASARQPTELLRSSGGEAEATGLANVRGDSKCGLQDSARRPWGGRGEASGRVQGLCMGTGSADTSATQGSQLGGLPKPPLVLSLSLG